MIEMPLFRILVMVLIVVAISSCGFHKLADDLEQLEEETHVFAGVVSVEGLEANRIVVAALRDQLGGQIASANIVSEPGPFEITSAPQRLWLFAFDDLNSDLTFQSNEPYGWGNNGQAVDPEIEATNQLIIKIVATPENSPPAPIDLIDNPLGNVSDIVTIQLGKVSSLNDSLFSEEQAAKGLWQPFAFMADGGTGIHFLEDYDPLRTPVLFVHGINGTPRNFTALIESLDRSQYQAWVFSYPSGWRLSSLANGMYQFMEMLHTQHQFDQLHIVAHSMGGLVSRGGLRNCMQSGACKYVRSYTTISTPWNGVASAKSGVEWAPTVVPVWRDLDPGSDYVTTLFDLPLQEGVPHYLIFGYGQDSVFAAESSDGVIRLSSQLRMAAQQQASQIRGYDEGHISIMSNESVTTLVNEILDSNSH